MKFRMFSASVLALVVGLAVLFPAPALGQHTRLIFGDDVGIWVSATDHQLIRVTIGNPFPPDPAGDRQLQSFVIEFDRPVDPVTILPGSSYKYIEDPRVSGVLVDPPTGLRHVRVSFRYRVDVVDGLGAPQPAVTIEFINRKSGAVESFQAFPGFTGGVVVAS